MLVPSQDRDLTLPWKLTSSLDRSDFLCRYKAASLSDSSVPRDELVQEPAGWASNELD